jgi:hypothetical protein
MASKAELSSSAVAMAKAHTILAKRVPAVQATGNKSKDDEKRSQLELFMDLIDHCQWDSSQNMPLYGTLKRRLAECGKPVGDDYFKEVSSVQKLCPTWMEAWGVENSQWSVEELQLAKAADEDTVLYLFCYATQFQLTMRLSSVCLHIQCMTKVCNERHVLCGSRLKELGTKLAWDAAAPMIKFKK